MSKKIILLNGPAIDAKNATYGGGTGGMTRNMAQYLCGYRSSKFEQQPCFHSVRQQGAGRFSLVRRLVGDTIAVYRPGRTADGIHIVAQYRTAIYREFAAALVCRILKLPMLYEIKAGVYIDWLESCPPWERRMALYILTRAGVLLCEGQVYVEYLRKEFGIESHYAPNFVLDDEIPETVQPKLQGANVRVLFVGFCYEGKGVFELVKGCEIAASEGVPIELTLVGQEDDDFARFLDASISARLSYKVDRMGRMEHSEVLALYESHDVFCMPTRHSGEGHTNTVNEAMMMGMVIISSRHGFLEDVLANDSSYFLDALTPTDISKALKVIHQDRDAARRRAARARARLQALFTSRTAFSNLSAHYEALTCKT